MDREGVERGVHAPRGRMSSPPSLWQDLLAGGGFVLLLLIAESLGGFLWRDRDGKS